MNNVINYIGYICIDIGLAFDVLGCIGLVRLPTVYNRLQASTKCVTLGTCFILIGGFFLNGFLLKMLLCAGFILMSSPVAAHQIALGAYSSGVKLWKNAVVDMFGKDTKGEEQFDRE